MSKIKAVIFDLDGTLINTLESLRYSMSETMKSFGLDPITLKECMQFVGNGGDLFLERSLASKAQKFYEKAEKAKDYDTAIEYDQKADEIMEYYDEAIDRYYKIFSENCTYEIEAYPGMKDLLKDLKEMGIKIACVTNKSIDECKICLSHVFSEDTFDYIAGDDGVHPLKPDRYQVDKALEAFNISKDEAIYIGDSNTDIETAKNSETLSIGCAYGFRGAKELQKYGADFVVDSCEEILPIIKKIG